MGQKLPWPLFRFATEMLGSTAVVKRGLPVYLQMKKRKKKNELRKVGGGNAILIFNRQFSEEFVLRPAGRKRLLGRKTISLLPGGLFLALSIYCLRTAYYALPLPLRPRMKPPTNALLLSLRSLYLFLLFSSSLSLSLLQDSRHLGRPSPRSFSSVSGATFPAVNASCVFLLFVPFWIGQPFEVVGNHSE